MFTSTNLDKLKQIMAESEEHADIIGRLISSYKESISVVTHEIRNPLTLVYSSLQLIESAHPEVHTFHHWDALHQDVLYMMQLLADLSNYNNGLSLHKKPLDTTAFFKQLVLSFAASSAASGIEFTSYIAPELPSVSADAPKLREVLLNLLKNAFEAFPSGTTGFVRLDTDTINSANIASDNRNTSSAPEASGNACYSDNAPDDIYLRIRIRDNGCGIPSQRMEDIFTPFVTFKNNGTGLGLPLSRRIIDAHGGTLNVTSSKEAGTVFTILLPVCSDSAPSDSCDTE